MTIHYLDMTPEDCAIYRDRVGISAQRTYYRQAHTDMRLNLAIMKFGKAWAIESLAIFDHEEIARGHF